MTTIVYFVTTNGIVMAADSKIVDNDFNNLGDAPKIVALSDSVAIANCGLGRANITVTDHRGLLPREHRFQYEFHEWVRQFAHLKDPAELTQSVAMAAEETFAPLNIFIEAGAIPEQQKLLAEYHIVGYRPDGTPVTGKVTVPIDWENRAVMQPEWGGKILKKADPQAFLAGGTNDAITMITKGAGAPFARARELEPILLDKFTEQRDLELAEAKRLAEVFILIEAEFSPAYVGLPVQFVVLDAPVCN